RQLGLKEGPTIVYVGGINAERDLATLLRAVSLLRGRTEIQVVIAGHGDPEYVESLKALASALPISDRVIFLPRIPQEQVLSYLALASLGVICYQENPLTEIAIPTKAFEYAAAGKPLAIARLRALARPMSRFCRCRGNPLRNWWYRRRGPISICVGISGIEPEQHCFPTRPTENRKKTRHRCKHRPLSTA